MNRLTRTAVVLASFFIILIAADSKNAEAMQFPCYACVDNCEDHFDNAEACWQQCRAYYTEECAGVDPSGSYCSMYDGDVLVACYTNPE